MHGGEGWAVSYADMLMVLLSFFVMFFSLKEESPQTFDDQLKKISLSMKSMDQAGGAGDTAPGHQPASVGANGAQPASGKDFSLLSDALKIDGVTVSNEKTQLVLTLDNTAYRSGVYQPNKAILSKVNEIVDHLKPYKGEVQMTIVGHTDSKKLRARNAFLQDNFDLSSLRALRVLKHVIAQGFPENHATARAASSFDRDARSVSIVIQLTEALHSDAAPVPAAPNVPDAHKATETGV